MVVSNVMSRSLVRLKQEVPDEIRLRVREEIGAEGRDTCALEDDEIENLYRKTTTYMRRIFGNSRLHPAIDDFAKALSCRREMSGLEIIDELRRLQII